MIAFGHDGDDIRRTHGQGFHPDQLCWWVSGIEEMHAQLGLIAGSTGRTDPAIVAHVGGAERSLSTRKHGHTVLTLVDRCKRGPVHRHLFHQVHGRVSVLETNGPDVTFSHASLGQASVA